MRPGNDGKFTVSRDEESWPCEEWFDMREDAVAYAKEHGIEFVGQVTELTLDRYMNADSAEWLMDQHEESMCDEWANEDPLIEPTKDEYEDLARRIREWLKERKLLRTWYGITTTDRVV